MFTRENVGEHLALVRLAYAKALQEGVSVDEMRDEVATLSLLYGLLSIADALHGLAGSIPSSVRVHHYDD